jgi:hypothetical protein
VRFRSPSENATACRRPLTYLTGVPRVHKKAKPVVNHRQPTRNMSAARSAHRSCRTRMQGVLSPCAHHVACQMRRSYCLADLNFETGCLKQGGLHSASPTTGPPCACLNKRCATNLPGSIRIVSYLVLSCVSIPGARHHPCTARILCALVLQRALSCPRR